jgi:hypothetical protein
MIELGIAMVGGGLCGLLVAVVGLGIWHLQRARPEDTPSPAPTTPAPRSKVIKLGAAAPRTALADPPTLPTEPGLALNMAAVAAAKKDDADDTWDDGEQLTQIRHRPAHVDLDDLTGKVVLTSGAGILIEDAAGKREWTAPRVHADVAPAIWIDCWGPLSRDELVLFARHYRQVERVLYDAPERLPTLLQELGYTDVGEWFQVYNTFLKHFGVGGPGDAIADYAFGQDFQDALFSAEF